MNVLHLISSGGMYGAEAVILQLGAAMKAGAQGSFSLGTFAHSGQADPALHVAAGRAGLRSELVPCKGQIDLSMPATLRALAAHVRADVIHAHGYKADIYAWAAFRGGDRPALVSTCHTWYDNDFAVRLYGAADRWVLRGFDEVVAVSAEVRARLVGGGVAPSHIHLILNGVNVGPFLPEGAEAADGSPVVRVGLVGRLAPEKGIDVFLRAVAQVGQNHPEVRFVIAGDGPERSQMEALAADLRVSQQVQFLGRVEDMRALYRSLDLLVSASRQEGLPMALLEGMASGLPLVATRVGEVPDIVVEGVTGLLVQPESPEALAQAMDRLLAEETLRKAFGRAGRQRIAQEFSAQRMAAEYLAVYEQALSGRPARNHVRRPVGSTV